MPFESQHVPAIRILNQQIGQIRAEIESKKKELKKIKDEIETMEIKDDALTNAIIVLDRDQNAQDKTNS